MVWFTTARSSSLELHHESAALVVLVLAALSAFLFLRKAISGRTNQWPPGPPAWPIVGHLHLLGQLPHQSLCTLSQRYGPLMGLRLGRVPTIVASSPEMAKEILQTHDLEFAYRPQIAAGLYLCFNFADAAFARYGPYFKFLRQLYATELFSSKRLEAFKHVREEERAALMRSVLRGGGQGDAKVEIRHKLALASNNINCRMVMGKRISEIYAEDTKLELASLIEEVLDLCGVFYVGDYIPWLAWLDTNGYIKRMKAAGQRTRALLQHVIDKRREEYSLRNQKEHGLPTQDLLDALLAAASSDNKDLDMQITDDNIMAAMLDIFVGGSDTSAVAVEWAMADLVNSPKNLYKLQEELDKVVGKERFVKENDLDNLPYLGSIIKESMRLHPAAPLLIPREGARECQIGGYTIPAKTRAYVNAWAIGRDPITWEQPLKFWPERFNEKNLDLQGKNFELLPFGIGRRKCPGWGLGLVTVHLMLASLVQGFAWTIETPSSPNDGSHTNVIDMSEKFGLVVAMAKPFNAFATPRLPLNLY